MMSGMPREIFHLYLKSAKTMQVTQTIFDAKMGAKMLFEAKKSRKRIDALPPDALPRSEEEAELIQNELAGMSGTVWAWKVGAATAQSTPFRAPIHADSLFVNPGRISASMFSYIGAEAEIAYKISKDLTAKHKTYTLDEVLESVGSVHPAIEIVDTRFMTWDSQPPLAHRADQGNHGALIIGDAIADWRSMKPRQERVNLELNGELVSSKIDGNSAGDPERLLLWLANIGAKALGGLKAGQYVTTGSCSGTIMVEAPVEITATLVGRGSVSLTID